MTRDELIQFHETICQRSRDLMQKKNRDYAGSDGVTPFANFTRSEAMGICSTEQGFLVRMTDKFSRLATFTSGGKLYVENESVDDILLDLINYSVLFGAYLLDKTSAAVEDDEFIEDKTSSR